MSKRTLDSLTKLVDEGRRLVIETEGDYARYRVQESQYRDTLRRISTVETDPELPEVQEENRVRTEHSEILRALREYEAKHFVEVGHAN